MLIKIALTLLCVGYASAECKVQELQVKCNKYQQEISSERKKQEPDMKKMCCTLNEELTCYSSDQDCVDQVKKSHERIASTIKIMCKKYKYDEVCIQKPEPESESESESAAEPENGAYRNVLSVFTLLPSLCILLRRYC